MKCPLVRAMYVATDTYTNKLVKLTPGVNQKQVKEIIDKVQISKKENSFHDAGNGTLNAKIKKLVDYVDVS